MSHRLLKRLSLCHLVMQALVMKTLMSSQSMSSVSHNLLIRKDGSVSTAIESKPPANRGMDDAMRRSIFGSSDESDEPSPKRRRSKSQDSGAHSGVGSPIDTTSQRGASTSVGTSQEERDRSVLRLAPEKRHGCLPNPSWITCRRRRVIVIEHGCSIRQGSITLTPVQKTITLNMSSSSMLSLNIDGRDVWNDKLIKARDKFEKRTPTGARYKLHRMPSELYEGINNLKSLNDRAGKTFSSGPSAAQDVPHRTSRPDPVRQPSVGSGAPKYPRTGGSRATGQDNSSDVRSRRSGSTAAQPDSAGHCESTLREVEEEGRRSPHNRGEACVPESFFDRVTQGLRGDLEHERDRRHQLADTVSRHRAELAFAQLENEGALTSLRDELRVARGDVERSRDEITALQTLVDAHHREHKALCEMLERKGILHRKKQRTDGTA
uniref:Uncharacterized protein n=1 Tax=Peronospora matthiolae TaxID=2874970 RepID=A0AAV1U6F8_9STRA